MRLFFLILSVLFALHRQASSAPAREVLPAKDRAFLESLLHDFLYDPAGAQRVALPMVDENGRRSYENAWSHEGWLVSGSRGQPAQVFSTDGDSMWFEPGHYKRIDFKAACRARYAPALVNGRAPYYEEQDLAVAAWLYRLHEPALAAKALAAARRAENDPRAALRHRLAQGDYGQVIRNFEIRGDESALFFGQRLLRVYAEEAKGDDFDQLEPIMKDLERRRLKGTFGQNPSKEWPAGFEQWEAARKAAWLIDSLEDIRREQDGYPGGVDFAADRRVKALIGLGDAAVPLLLDALEKGDRLTRSSQSWRMGIGTTLLNVREPVLTALMSILQVQAFQFAATGDNFTGRGEETAMATAKRLREYWRKYGGLPFDERMMKVLTDPQSSVDAKREAAVNLGALGEKISRGTMFGVNPRVLQAAAEPNPAVAKFDHPTAAEAILSAMGADLRAFDASEAAKEETAANTRVVMASTYLWALVHLGDRRIASAVVERFTPPPSLLLRSKVAVAAAKLGLEQPLRTLTEEVRRGPEAHGAGELDQWLTVLFTLLPVETDEVKAAVEAVLHPEHPLYAALEGTNSYSYSSSDYEIPRAFTLKLLRVALDDPTPNGQVAKLEKGKVSFDNGNGSSSSGPVPAYLKATARNPRTVQIRRCDNAAETLSRYSGLPFYDPLLADAPERLQQLRSVLDHYWKNYLGQLGAGPTTHVFPDGDRFGPIFPLLGHSATAEDVAAGQAIFHLQGQGKPAPLALPAFATLKHSDQRTLVTIVQAEVDARGRTTYGIIEEHAIRTALRDELKEIEPYTAAAARLEKQRAEWEDQD